MKTFKKAKDALYRAVLALPREILPLTISNPVGDIVTGCDFDRMEYKTLVPGGQEMLVLSDRYNNTGLVYPVSQMQAAALAGIIADAARKDADAVPGEAVELAGSVGKMKELLYGHEERTEELVAGSRGMNMTYCESMDFGETFPTFLDIIVRGDIPGDEDREGMERVRLTLSFLAENRNYIPETIKDEPYETLVSYVLNHQDEILDGIRSEVDYYYEGETGEKADIFKDIRIPSAMGNHTPREFVLGLIALLKENNLEYVSFDPENTYQPEPYIDGFWQGWVECVYLDRDKPDGIGITDADFSQFFPSVWTGNEKPEDKKPDDDYFEEVFAGTFKRIYGMDKTESEAEKWLKDNIKETATTEK